MIASTRAVDCTDPYGSVAGFPIKSLRFFPNPYFSWPRGKHLYLVIQPIIPVVLKQKPYRVELRTSGVLGCGIPWFCDELEPNAVYRRILIPGTLLEAYEAIVHLYSFMATIQMVLLCY